MTDDNQLDGLFPDGFIGIRAGIKEHITGGRFNATDLGVYLFLHAFAAWRCGVCYTNAVAIGNALRTPTTTINDSLARLRTLKYINYPKGVGQRGSYPILIHKYRPTLGVLRGYELDAFSHNHFDLIWYVLPDGTRVEAVWKPCADRAEAVLMSCGDRVLTVCIEDNKACKDDQNDQADIAGKPSGTPSESVSKDGAKPIPADSNSRSCGICGAKHDGTYGDLCVTCYDDEMKKPEPKPKAPVKSLGFDPLTIGAVDDYTPAQVRTVAEYHWNYSKDSFWRDKCHSEAFFRKNFAKMAAQVPRKWSHAKAETEAAASKREYKTTASRREFNKERLW